ncbi:ATP-binding protein [Pedobacter nutrimenti]|uniref:AAA family ATPase n=1 Tax=Pedobacter nutrimenti TaxID=1241337 RepID=UPI00292CBBE9|nr:ATP-binding protein [Pedobacter nutrimenti]
MIIQFSFNNYKTFKDRTVLNLIASNYDKDTNEEENIIHIDKYNLRLLKSSVIFGANASGKSKFIDAITFFKSYIQSSSKETQKGEPIAVIPFKLNEASPDRSSDFEMIFILNGIIYRYGFEATRSKIIAEWLYVRSKSKEEELFYRTLQKFEVNEKKLDKALPLIKSELVRDNALLISVLAQFNDALASSIILYFESINCVSGLREMEYKNNSILKVRDNPEKKGQILELLKIADFGIEDIRFEDIASIFPEKDKVKIQELQKLMSDVDSHAFSSVRTTHKVFNDKNEITGSIEFLMNAEESEGTQKYFYLTGLILDALENGTILFVDELDSKLHPNLVCKIVSLFNSNITNPKNAQLIFNTHDTNLLSSGLFRRDQIWFIDKDRYGASKLYSLADFKTSSVRKNESFEDNYIRGKYGATPFLGEFEEITRKILAEDGKAK